MSIWPLRWKIRKAHRDGRFLRHSRKSDKNLGNCYKPRAPDATPLAWSFRPKPKSSLFNTTFCAGLLDPGIRRGDDHARDMTEGILSKSTVLRMTLARRNLSYLPPTHSSTYH